jgi:hypothetical protein
MHLDKGDELWRLFNERDLLLRTGRVVWGNITQANVLMFQRGWLDCPAGVLYSYDPFFDSRPEVLHHTASSLFGLKGTIPDDEELREFAATLTDEMSRPFDQKLPRRLAGGIETIHSAIMVHRRHLPSGRFHRGYLAQGMFPLIISDETPTTMILPSHFWPKSLIQLWRSGYNS